MDRTDISEVVTGVCQTANLNTFSFVDWAQIVSAGGVVGAALASWFTIRMIKRGQALELRPQVSIVGSQTRTEEGEAGSRFQLVLENSGRGVARLRAVDLYCHKIRADLGTPVEFGPESKKNPCVEIFLPQRDKKYRFQVAIYYDDIAGHGYVTESSMEVAHFTEPPPYHTKEHWIILAHRTVPFCIGDKTSKIYHWRPDEEPRDPFREFEELL